MKISKKDLLYLVEQKLNEMPMEFPRSLNVRRPNPNYDPNREENDDNPKSIEVEVPFNERPNVDIQNKLQRQDTPIKKVPLPSGQGNQNFQEMLASETYQEIIRRVKEATGIDANNLLTIMMNAVHEVDSAEMEHKEELERLAAESVFNLYKIPQDSVNIFVKLISISGRRGIPTDDFLHKQDNENPEAPEVGDENPQSMNVNDIDDMEVEQDYVSKLENFDLERAKRRLINAMTQGAAHSAYNLYKYVADRIRQIVPETPSGTDIMDLYATMMSINDTNYWFYCW
jgi:flagellar motor switch/type III secretory pathway protein FliN